MFFTAGMIGAIFIHIPLYCMESARASSIHTRLVNAVRNGTIYDVSQALKTNPHINALDVFGYTPMHHAANRSQAIIELLMQAGGDVSYPSPSRGITPLHLAVWYGNKETAIALVQAGADITLQDNEGTSPLEQSSRLRNERANEHEELVTACRTTITYNELVKTIISPRIHLISSKQKKLIDAVAEKKLKILILKSILHTSRAELHKLEAPQAKSHKHSCFQGLLRAWNTFVERLQMP